MVPMQEKKCEYVSHAGLMRVRCNKDTHTHIIRGGGGEARRNVPILIVAWFWMTSGLRGESVDKSGFALAISKVQRTKFELLNVVSELVHSVCHGCML